MDRTKAYYIKVYNLANSKKDKRIRDLQKKDNEAYQRSVRIYQNDQVEKFVINDSEKNKPIVEYDGRLIQKIDPIFHGSRIPLYKSSFLCPTKNGFWQVQMYFLDKYFSSLGHDNFFIFRFIFQASQKVS